jgi:hypothetical protein
VLEFTLPAGYQLDYVPPPVELTSEFGTYLAKIRIENNKLIYSRKLILQSGEHAPDTYESLIRFFKRIHNADNAKLVLVKQ